MLRLNVYCSLVPGPRQVKIGSNFASLVNHRYHGGAHRVPLRIRISSKAIKDEMDGGTSGLPGPSWDPGLEFEVPFEQRPVNEYSSLKDAILYSWGELSPRSFFLRLGGLWLVTFTTLGVPIAAASFNPIDNTAGTSTLCASSWNRDPFSCVTNCPENLSGMFSSIVKLSSFLE